MKSYFPTRTTNREAIWLIIAVDIAIIVLCQILMESETREGFKIFGPPAFSIVNSVFVYIKYRDHERYPQTASLGTCLGFLVGIAWLFLETQGYGTLEPLGAENRALTLGAIFLWVILGVASFGRYIHILNKYG